MIDELTLYLKAYWPVLLLIAFIFFRIYKSKVARDEINALGPLSEVQLVDVRSVSEFSRYSLPGSLNIPLQEIKSKSNKLDMRKAVVVFCVSGTRSAGARSILKSRGFDRVINGGSVGNIKTVLSTETV